MFIPEFEFVLDFRFLRLLVDEVAFALAFVMYGAYILLPLSVSISL